MHLVDVGELAFTSSSSVCWVALHALSQRVVSAHLARPPHHLHCRCRRIGPDPIDPIPMHGPCMHADREREERSSSIGLLG